MEVMQMKIYNYSVILLWCRQFINWVVWCAIHTNVWTLVRIFFRHHWCVLNQSSNIPTKFDDDWSNSNEMATVFQNSRWRRPPQICIFDVTDMFQIEVLMFPLILVTIGQIVKKWQQCFEIQDGGSRHLEKYTSGWTIITRTEFLVYNFQSKM